MNTNKRILFTGLAILAGVSSAWANSYAQLTISGGETGKGYVYGATANTVSPEYGTQDVIVNDGISESSATKKYYAWAKPARGSKFYKWNLSGDGNPSRITNNLGIADVIQVTSPPSTGTNEAKAMAQWITYKPCAIHLHSSAYGAYSIKYEYADFDNLASSFKDYMKSVFVDKEETTLKDVAVYYTDKITLTVNDGDIQGWYQDENFTVELDGITGSGDSYTFTAPQNTESETERHIYPKFAEKPKLCSKLHLKYADGSADGAGMLAVTKNADMTPCYSFGECSLVQTSIVDDVSVPVKNNYYLHAKTNNMQYSFVGWFSSSVPSLSTLISSDADYIYALEASSSDVNAPTENTVYAMFTRINTHYFEMTAEPATAGLGMVYVSQSHETDPDYSVFSNYSQVLAEEVALADSAAGTKFYLYAKPKYGYKFEGWYSDVACLNRVATANPYIHDAKANSTDPANPDKVTMYAKFVLANPISVTFEYPTGGSYSAKALDIVENDEGEYVWGETSTLYNSVDEVANKAMLIYPTSDMILTAVPNEGNAVKSWKIAGEKFLNGSLIYYTSATKDKVYGVTFGISSPFKVGDNTYATLDAAIANLGSNKTIVVVEDAVVQTGIYEIPSNVTLLIPKNSTQTTAIGTIASRVTSKVNPSKYVCLTLENGAVLSINGTLEVSCDENVGGQGASGVGVPSGPYGQIDMKKGSEIHLESGSKLIAWGYITGDGVVRAKNGSTVYEMFQMLDWKGGTASSNMIDNEYKILPISQYAIQNVEVPLLFFYGSQEIVSTGVDLKYVGNVTADNIVYIGSAGMFSLSEEISVVRKEYDFINDKQKYKIKGNAQLNDFELNLTSTVKNISIKTQNYRLPLTNNMVVNIASGTTSLNANGMVMLAGAEIYIDNEATLNVPSAKELILYDSKEWGSNYAFNGKATHSVPYSPTKKTNHGITDAKLHIKGKLVVGGSLYTTISGAEIVSSIHNPGQVQFNSTVPSDNIMVYQYTAASSSSQEGKTATPAQLQNADATYIATRGEEVGSIFTYFLGEWKKNLATEGCFVVDAVGHKYITTNGGYKDVIASVTYAAAWESRDANSTLYIHTADNCDWIEVSTVQGLATYLKDNDGQYYEYDADKGYWVPAEQYVMTFQNYKNKTIYTSTIFPNGTPTYAAATPIRPSDESGLYVFAGWKRADDATIYASNALPALNENTTFVAQFDKKPYVASITSLGIISNHTTFISALAEANTMTTNPTLKLLADVTGLTTSQSVTKSMTLDLNGHKLSGTANGLLSINTAGINVTIMDKSENQQGQISATGNLASGNFYAVSVSNGTLILDGGNIYGQNSGNAAVYVVNIEKAGTFEMKSGCITTTDASKVNGILTKTNKTILSGGKISVPISVVYISNGYSMTEKMSISGGWFSGNKIVHGGVTVPTDKVNIIGGYYSTNANLDACVSDPYKVLGNDDATYKYKVAEAYEVTWKNGATELAKDVVEKGIIPQYTGTTPTRPSTYVFDGWSESDGGEVLATIPAATKDVTYYAHFTQTELVVGSPLDIIDWTANTLTLNMNGTTGWPLTIQVGDADALEYQKTDRKADRTLVLPYSGSADADIVIKVTNKSNGDVYSQHTYSIPQIYDADADLGEVRPDGHSIIFVHQGKLSVTSNATVGAVYVGPSAELEVDANVELTVDSLMLRTTPWEAAVLTNDGIIQAGKTYYTRIISDNSQYYQFALPLAVEVEKVHLSNYMPMGYGVTWVLKQYSEYYRATEGAGGANEWQVLTDFKTINPSAGYEMFSNTGNFYCEYYFPVTLPKSEATTVPVSYTENGAAGAAHAGWNALCSPMLRKANIPIMGDPSEAVKVSLLQVEGFYVQTIPTVIMPAVPFYYQAKEKGTMSFTNYRSNAPRRAWKTSVPTQWLRLVLNDATGRMLDETNIFTHPEKFSVDYESGYDVTKQSTIGGKALLYSELACGALAFAALPDTMAEARIPLTVYAAAAKLYTFHLEDNAYLNRLGNVFLHDTETGAVIDLLASDYEVMLREGTIRGRFYITCVFRAPNITTDVETTVQDKQTAPVQKVLYNGKVYILRNGIVYDLTGRQCEMK